MSPGFWLNLQMRCDLYRAQLSEEQEIKSIKVHKHTGSAA
jgi:plasmid maintenance system antidote protein VapI